MNSHQINDEQTYYGSQLMNKRNTPSYLNVVLELDSTYALLLSWYVILMAHSINVTQQLINELYEATDDKKKHTVDSLMM